MPEIGVNSKPRAKPGKHKMTLVNVDIKVGKNPFAKDEDGSTDEDAVRERFVWEFESDETNEFGEHLTYSVWTNTNYGNDRAGLTKFLNQIIPGLAAKGRAAVDEVRHMNTDALLGTRYEVILREQQGKGGTTFVGHTDIAPILTDDGTVERVLVAGDPALQGKSSEPPM